MAVQSKAGWAAAWAMWAVAASGWAQEAAQAPDAPKPGPIGRIDFGAASKEAMRAAAKEQEAQMNQDDAANEKKAAEAAAKKEAAAAKKADEAAAAKKADEAAAKKKADEAAAKKEALAKAAAAPQAEKKAAASAPAASEAAPPAPAQTLAEQIKEALDGKGGTLSLNSHRGAPGKPAGADKAKETAKGAVGNAPAKGAVGKDAKPASVAVLKNQKGAAGVPAAKAADAACAPKGAAVQAGAPSKRPMAKKPKAEAAAEAKPLPAQWSYSGSAGPAAWGALDPSFSSCAEGSRQSPMGIESASAMPGAIDELVFGYAAGPAREMQDARQIWIEFGKGSELMARGQKYALVQAKLRHPSEEKIDGAEHPLGVQLIHRSATGEWAVVAVEFEIGAPSAAIDSILKSAPLGAGDSVSMGQADAAGAGFDPSALLPAAGKRKYFQYIGSSTEPPCAEGVLWMVMEQPMTASAEQVAELKRLFGPNARPQQPANGRLVREK